MEDHKVSAAAEEVEGGPQDPVTRDAPADEDDDLVLEPVVKMEESEPKDKEEQGVEGDVNEEDERELRRPPSHPVIQLLPHDLGPRAPRPILIENLCGPDRVRRVVWTSYKRRGALPTPPGCRLCYVRMKRNGINNSWRRAGQVEPDPRSVLTPRAPEPVQKETNPLYIVNPVEQDHVPEIGYRMNVSCLLPWCKAPYPMSLSWHCIPNAKKFPETRRKWIQALGLANRTTPLENLRLCSRHFADDDFERDLKSELLHKKKRWTLKRTAVPSGRPIVKTDDGKSDSSLRRDKRMKKKERQEMVEKILAETSVESNPVAKRQLVSEKTRKTLSCLIKPVPQAEIIMPSTPDANVAEAQGPVPPRIVVMPQPPAALAPVHSVFLQQQTRRALPNQGVVAVTPQGPFVVSSRRSAESQTDPLPTLSNQAKAASEEKDRTISELRRRLNVATRANNRLRARNEKRANVKEKDKLRYAKEILLDRTAWSPAQIAVFLEGKDKARWSEEDKQMAGMIKNLTSKRVYNFLRVKRLLPLPCLTSIQKHISKERRNKKAEDCDDEQDQESSDSGDDGDGCDGGDVMEAEKQPSLVTQATEDVVLYKVNVGGQPTFHQSMPNLQLNASMGTDKYTKKASHEVAYGNLKGATSLSAITMSDPGNHEFKRPPLSYPGLIREALDLAPTGKLYLADICQGIRDRHPFYRTCSLKWQRAVKTTLSRSSEFVKTREASGTKGHLWQCITERTTPVCEEPVPVEPESTDGVPASEGGDGKGILESSPSPGGTSSASPIPFQEEVMVKASPPSSPTPMDSTNTEESETATLAESTCPASAGDEAFIGPDVSSGHNDGEISKDPSSSKKTVFAEDGFEAEAGEEESLASSVTEDDFVMPSVKPCSVKLHKILLPSGNPNVRIRLVSSSPKPNVMVGNQIQKIKMLKQQQPEGAPNYRPILPKSPPGGKVMMVVKQVQYRAMCAMPGCLAPFPVGTTFHRIPPKSRFPVLHNMWLKVMGLATGDKKLLVSHRVCSQHFLKGDFEEERHMHAGDGTVKLVGGRLKKGRVPTPGYRSGPNAPPPSAPGALGNLPLKPRTATKKIQTEVDATKRRNAELKTQNESLRKALSRARRRTELLREKLAQKVERKPLKQAERLQIAREVLVENTPWSDSMARNFIGGCATGHWSDSDMQLGMMIRKMSLRTFKFLQEMSLLPLPGKSTLLKAEQKRKKNGGEGTNSVDQSQQQQQDAENKDREDEGEESAVEAEKEGGDHKSSPTLEEVLAEGMVDVD